MASLLKKINKNKAAIFFVVVVFFSLGFFVYEALQIHFSNLGIIDYIGQNEAKTVYSQKRNVLQARLEEQAEEAEEEPDPVEEVDLQELEVEDTDQADQEESGIDEQEEEDLETEPKQPEELPDPIRHQNSDLVIGFITDPHVKSYKSANGTILHEKHKKSIQYFVETMNNKIGPDFLIINGDVIEGTKTPAQTGMQQLSQVKEVLDQTKIPKYYVIGNHDLRSITKKQWKTTLGISYTNTSFDIGNYRIIIMDSNFDNHDNDIKPGEYYTRGYVNQDQVRWLKNRLRETEKEKIVFIHHPPIWDVKVRDNNGLLGNALELQGLFEKYDVLAVFAGHIEDLYYDKENGVKYFTIPGMTKNEKYPGSFAEISVKDDDVEVDLNYMKSDGSYRTIDVD